VSQKRLNQKGFTMVAALSLAAVLAVGAIFLGKVLAYVKATRMRTQARISSLGYEDSMAVVVAQGVVGKNCVFDQPIPPALIPGTNANLRFCNINRANSTLTFAAYLNDGSGLCNGQVPPEITGSSERFIDGTARIDFRVDLISKAMPQDEKVFGVATPCGIWNAAGNERQVKISYQIRRMFRGKPLSQSGSKIINLSELGVN
jgi:hypothetical protein